MSVPNFSSLARLEVPEKFLWVGGWWVGWGLQSHFHVKPNRCVEVRLGFWQLLFAWLHCEYFPGKFVTIELVFCIIYIIFCESADYGSVLYKKSKIVMVRCAFIWKLHLSILIFYHAICVWFVGGKPNISTRGKNVLMTHISKTNIKIELKCNMYFAKIMSNSPISNIYLMDCISWPTTII